MGVEGETALARARAPGPSVQDVLDLETRPVPACLREQAVSEAGSDALDVRRWIDADFHRLEVERLWPRVWQMACREEAIPGAGDHVRYEVGPLAILVVRTEDGRIRAFHDSCPHRGRTLQVRRGTPCEIRCPYHGFGWSLDGAIRDVPCRWDFPGVRASELELAPLRVGTWGGFVFVNPDHDAISLEAYLAPLPEHFRAWRLEDRRTTLHVGKVVEANWKLCAEAFLESHHARGLHAHLLGAIGWANTQYDTWPGRNVSRLIAPLAVPSTGIDPALSGQSILDALLASEPGAPGGVRLPAGQSARSFLAGANRRYFAERSGRDLSAATDCEVLDAIEYFAFPNFFPWGGYRRNLTFRFRPWEDRHDRSLMEVLVLEPTRAGAEREKPAPLRLLAPDEPWSSVKQLRGMGRIFDQDEANLPAVQRGLRASPARRVRLTRYQDSRIRHFHDLLDRLLARAATTPPV